MERPIACYLLSTISRDRNICYIQSWIGTFSLVPFISLVCPSVAVWTRHVCVYIWYMRWSLDFLKIIFGLSPTSRREECAPRLSWWCYLPDFRCSRLSHPRYHPTLALTPQRSQHLESWKTQRWKCNFARDRFHLNRIIGGGQGQEETDCS